MQFASVANEPTLERAPTTKPGLAREFRHLWQLARYQWSRGARPWLGIATALATALVALFLHYHLLRPELWRSGDVYASLPLTSELARLPMSLFLPTAYLPLWAACAQLLVVIGLGELILGRWLTIVVAGVAHFGSTLVARVLLQSVHGHFFGLAPALAHVLDTGPSAATTAVGACLLISTRMNRCALLLSVSLIAAAILAPGVDGVEHTTALACGVAAGVVDYVVFSRLSTTRDANTKVPWRVRFAWLPRVARPLRRAMASMLLHGEAR